MVNHVLFNELTDSQVGQLVRHQAMVAFREKPISESDKKIIYSEKNLIKLETFLDKNYKINTEKVQEKVLEDVEKVLKEKNYWKEKKRENRGVSRSNKKNVQLDVQQDVHEEVQKDVQLQTKLSLTKLNLDKHSLPTLSEYYCEDAGAEIYDEKIKRLISAFVDIEADRRAKTANPIVSKQAVKARMFTNYKASPNHDEVEEWKAMVREVQEKKEAEKRRLADHNLMIANDNLARATEVEERELEIKKGEDRKKKSLIFKQERPEEWDSYVIEANDFWGGLGFGVNGRPRPTTTQIESKVMDFIERDFGPDFGLDLP